ncbi:MAG: hypothetical protein R3D66_05325 [Alphaproteobacteria bacterium]
MSRTKGGTVKKIAAGIVITVALLAGSMYLLSALLLNGINRVEPFDAKPFDAQLFDIFFSAPITDIQVIDSKFSGFRDHLGYISFTAQQFVPLKNQEELEKVACTHEFLSQNKAIQNRFGNEGIAETLICYEYNTLSEIYLYAYDRSDQTHYFYYRDF